jgi:3-oxoacyl-[acyl-carrier-protein] synthase II
MPSIIPTFAVPKKHLLRIHIHGRGSISAAGPSPESAWETYRRGKAVWSRDKHYGLPVYAVNSPPKEETADFARKHPLSRTASLALAAAHQAISEAGWRGKDFAILVGCSRGPTGEWEKNFTEFATTGRVEPRTSPSTTLGSIGFALGEFFSTSSLASSLSVTCSSGMHALLHGIALLDSGMADRVLVGGAEAPLTAFTLQQMQALRIYAGVPPPHQHACQPLAIPPSGMVVGEGAGFLALSKVPRQQPPVAEEGSSTGAIRAYPYITGLGYARESGKTATGISPDGEGLFAAMRKATGKAGAQTFIVAHPPRTPQGDKAEGRAITRLFPEVPVTSFKWATGHSFGASGSLAMDAAISCLTHRQYLCPPYLGQRKAPQSLQRALVNATGFGGNAVSVMLELAPESSDD